MDMVIISFQRGKSGLTEGADDRILRGHVRHAPVLPGALLYPIMDSWGDPAQRRWTSRQVPAGVCRRALPCC
jgi:hypothetical protein